MSLFKFEITRRIIAGIGLSRFEGKTWEIHWHRQKNAWTPVTQLKYITPHICLSIRHTFALQIPFHKYPNSKHSTLFDNISVEGKTFAIREKGLNQHRSWPHTSRASFAPACCAKAQQSWFWQSQGRKVASLVHRQHAPSAARVLRLCISDNDI